MPLRLLLAMADDESLNLMYATLEAALRLTYLDISVAEAHTRDELLGRVDRQLDDLTFLEWQMVGAGTPTLVAEILSRNPWLRVVVLLPEPQQQYRLRVWEAGACMVFLKNILTRNGCQPSFVLCIGPCSVKPDYWKNCSQNWAMARTQGISSCFWPLSEWFNPLLRPSSSLKEFLLSSSPLANFNFLCPSAKKKALFR
jgi:hypothetical protein